MHFPIVPTFSMFCDEVFNVKFELSTHQLKKKKTFKTMNLQTFVFAYFGKKTQLIPAVFSPSVCRSTLETSTVESCDNFKFFIQFFFVFTP